jgi:hypothetical protein
MPRHFSRERNRAYFDSAHYTESKEYAAEMKFELFCAKLKSLLLGKGKDGNQSKN